MTSHELRDDPRQLLGYLGRVSGVVRSSGADVLHAHGTWQAALPLVFHQHLRTVFTIHTEPALHRLRTREVIRLTLAIADITTTVSEYMRQRILRLFPSVRIVVTRPVISFPSPVDKAGARLRLGLPPDGLVLAFATPLVYPEKVAGLRILFEAIRHGNLRARVVIAGDGPLEAVIRTYAEASGLEETTSFVHGHSDITDVLAACDIYVHASLRDNLPIALLEAMSSAKPVVAFPAGGIPEVVVHGRTGMLCRPNPSELVEQLTYLRDNPMVADELGIAAKAAVAQGFNWRAVAPVWSRVYGG